MVKVIYIDILIVVNLFVNYFLLLATSKFVHIKIGSTRIIFSAFISSLFSLMILFPPINYLIMLIIKFIMALFIVYISFGFKSKSIYIKNTVIFFGINFIFAGVMMLLWLFITPTGMYFNNGTVYFNISAIFLVISSVIAYWSVKLFKFILDKNVSSSETYDLEIEVDGKNCILRGFIDTGNNLTDYISGTPVCICYFEKVKFILPYELHNLFKNFNIDDENLIQNHNWRKRIRVIPYNVISGNGLIASFKPDKCILHKDSKKINIDTLLGVSNTNICDGEYDLIINNKLKI